MKYLPFSLTQVKRQAALVSMVFSISLLIYCLTTTAKVPIRITLKAPAWEMIIEINPQSPSRFHFREDTTGVVIAADQ